MFDFLYGNSDYGDYNDVVGTDRNPFNLVSISEFYFYSFMAIAGVCFLVWAGYLQYRDNLHFRNSNNDIIVAVIGMTATAISFFNLLGVNPQHIKGIYLLFLIIFGGFVCSLIVEGSTRYFILRNEKKTH